MHRRTFLRRTAVLAVGSLLSPAMTQADTSRRKPMVWTVLGPVEPDRLGCTLMHEHAPIVDWSELYETPAAPTDPVVEKLLGETEKRLVAWHESLPKEWRPGTIVECTPIRVGRYPDLLVKLARRVPVHIVGCTGFWCEAMAPQHPWALRLGLEKDGVRKIADLYVREIRDGMEDPTGRWGERFTQVRAGIIKCATSTYLRPTERRCHEAAALASIETGCPITTHTTDGGGLEQAELFIKAGVRPEKIVIGHQGNKDDREHSETLDYHRRLAELGCHVQYDRVGHEAYPVEKMARLIQGMVAAGFTERVLVSHDHVPFVYSRYAAREKPPEGWTAHDADFLIATSQLVPALLQLGVPEKAVRTILLENPRRVLAF